LPNPPEKQLVVK